MKKLLLLLLACLPTLTFAEDRKWVTSNAIDYFLSYSDGSRKIITYYSSGYHSEAMKRKETQEDIMEDLKEGRSEIFQIAPSSTVLDSAQVHYNSIEVNYGLTFFNVESAVRITDTFYFKDGKFVLKGEYLRKQSNNIK